MVKFFLTKEIGSVPSALRQWVSQSINVIFYQLISVLKLKKWEHGLKFDLVPIFSHIKLSKK